MCMRVCTQAYKQINATALMGFIGNQRAAATADSEGGAEDVVGEQRVDVGIDD